MNSGYSVDVAARADKSGRECCKARFFRTGFVLLLTVFLIITIAGISLSNQSLENASASEYEYGRTLAVPAQYGSIQSAINAAYDGDTVLVSSGTYSENINFNGKAIAVASVYGPSSTLIEGTGGNSPVVTFNHGESSSAVLDGFTVDNRATAYLATKGISITSGAAPTLRNSIIKGNNISTGQTGAGIYINGGGATIESSTIGTESSPNVGGGFGGGIYATGSGSALTISDSIISYNQCPNGGAGIYMTSKSALTTITNTTFINNYSPQTGGGIYSNGSPLSITGSTFSNNSVTATGMNAGALYLAGAAATSTVSDTDFIANSAGGAGGGAIYITLDADLTLTDGNLEGNFSGATSGGAVFVNGSGSSANISRSYLRGNDAAQYGGGVYLAGGAQATLTSCIISGNTADYFTYSDGGGIYNNGSTLNVINSTIAGNFAKRYGGGLRGAASITNSIIWGNSSNTSGSQIYGSPSVSFSDVQGGYSGEGNNNLDPRFVDFRQASLENATSEGDFHLLEASPLVNAASAEYAPDGDIDGDVRPQGPADDIGADEYQYLDQGVTAPTMGLPVAISTGSIRWNFSDNAGNETGFRLHDDSSASMAEYMGTDMASIDEYGLAANTRYTRHVHAFNESAESDASASASVYTLAVAPNVGANKVQSGWYNTADVTFINAAAFGYGSVEYYRYSWDQSPTHTFTDNESRWNSGNLTTTATAAGAWYLHVRSYNGDGIGSGTRDLGPYNYDPVAPNVISFAATSPTNRPDIPITSFAASDNAAVAAYLITTSSTRPGSGSAGWSSSAPSSYHVDASGTYTLYPWVKDAAGNVSEAYSSPATVIVNISSEAQILQVPSEYGTIQAAIDAASNGDTVLVADGVYDENITFRGKAITVQSVNGAGSTAIQGTGVNSPVVTFASGETANAVLDGFVIDNQAAAGNLTRGIYIAGNSSPSIRNCTINGNYSSANGSGVYITGATSTVTLTDTNVTGNSTTMSGGGIWSNSPLSISRGSVSDNAALNTASAGGGLYLSGSAVMTISGTSISENSAQWGGGVYSSGPKLTVTGSYIEGNYATHYSGGGLSLSGGAASAAYISDSYIRGNSAQSDGGGVWISSTTKTTITNCIISGNSAAGTGTTSYGGGVFGSTLTTVINSTIGGNYSGKYGGGYSGGGTITNSIIYGNSATTGLQITGSPTVSYSDIQGGFTGAANANYDPQFVEIRSYTEAPTSTGNYHLQQGSLCRDAASAQYAPASDIDGDVRPQGAAPDMGADELTYCAGSKPPLALSTTSAYWGSYSDYLIRKLSVDFNVRNEGVDPANAVQVNIYTGTAGVVGIGDLPVSLGTIDGGSSKPLTLFYSVPYNVNAFRTTVYFSAEDACGSTYEYPGPYSGA
ncbi:MAG: right-handed parallel beta-helix repeat-containing protein [Actinobacteria bacterium]|nr:right-handed parallel beta-helix repeat-containing protein [Actinomycetota bacterium]